MGPRDREPQLSQQRFEVFLNALLAMETDLIMQGHVAASEPAGGDVIGLAFSHPRLRFLFHKGPFPWQQSPAGMNCAALGPCEACPGCEPRGPSGMEP